MQGYGHITIFRLIRNATASPRLPLYPAYVVKIATTDGTWRRQGRVNRGFSFRFSRCKQRSGSSSDADTNLRIEHDYYDGRSFHDYFHRERFCRIQSKRPSSASFQPYLTREAMHQKQHYSIREKYCYTDNPQYCRPLESVGLGKRAPHMCWDVPSYSDHLQRNLHQVHHWNLVRPRQSIS